MSEHDKTIKRINDLLNKTVENGATEAEAGAALELAQKLMAKHMIEESQLADHAKDKACKKITIPKFKTGYDTADLNEFIARAFDCRCWWNDHRGEVYFFGFGDDARLAAYFYNYLNNAIVNEAERYKKTFEYIDQKIMGFAPRTILSSFRKGMIRRLRNRLVELKASRVSNVVQTTGTNLVLVKDARVNDEYDALGLKLKSHRSNGEINSEQAYNDGKKRADAVNMAGGIEGKEESKQVRHG